MSSSEGEQFESADESFEKEGEKAANKTKIKKSVTLKSEKNDVNSSKKETKENIQQDEISKVEENWDIEHWGDEDITTVVRTQEGVEKEEIVHDLTDKSKSKSVDNSIIKTGKAKSADGWDDFDGNWDDDQTVAHANISSTKPNIEQQFSDQVADKEICGIFDKLTKNVENTNKSSSWGNWSSWGGVVSLLSTASESVVSITSNVSKGISNAIETGIGVPDPTELAKAQNEETKKMKDLKLDDAESEDKLLDLGNLVSNVTQISNRVITGGLDTLEGIGKKTMNILQENDPGLINKRKMLGLDNDRPVLSQILREAKEKTEETERNLKLVQKSLYRKQIHFETLFDDYHGLVHLEALEMLSKQSSINLNSLLLPLSGKALQDLQETLNEVVELCELPDDNDDSDGSHTSNELSEKLSAAVEDLDVLVDFTDIIKCWEENIKWLEADEITSQDIHDTALRCLAKTTSLAVHQMHKLAEKLLVLEHHSTANEADSLVQLTGVLSWHLSGVATRFSGKLGENGLNDEINNLITSIFLEGSNSTSYIQRTFQLFIPILQVGAA